jgi:hypothetical protein
LFANYREIYFNCHAKQAVFHGRVHPQVAWAKLRNGAAIASKKLWS